MRARRRALLHCAKRGGERCGQPCCRGCARGCNRLQRRGWCVPVHFLCFCVHPLPPPFACLFVVVCVSPTQTHTHTHTRSQTRRHTLTHTYIHASIQTHTHTNLETTAHGPIYMCVYVGVCLGDDCRVLLPGGVSTMCVRT